MELAKIDVAPKNGDFIILQDACSREVGRWAQEANGWVQPDGTPVRISPTHWTRVSDDFAGPTDRERLLFLAALAAPGLIVTGATDVFPDLLLSGVVGRDRERHELLKRHAVFGIDLVQLW